MEKVFHLLHSVDVDGVSATSSPSLTTRFCLEENINLDQNFSHEHSISQKLSKSDNLVLENINVIIIFESSPLLWSGRRGGTGADHRSITRMKGKTGKGLGRRVLPKKNME